jgi:hypothetical protein
MKLGRLSSCAFTGIDSALILKGIQSLLIGRKILALVDDVFVPFKREGFQRSQDEVRHTGFGPRCV